MQSDSKRQTCGTCLRPERACICGWITPTAHMVDVLVLQHPMEVHNAKGSARLLHLSLPHSRLVVGERFDEQMLQALLDEPFQSRSHAPHPILLYPDTPEAAALGLAEPATLPEALLHHPAQLRLVVLDGTWRKSRKMLYLNPLLQRLPRLRLHDVPASRYLIRKAHRTGQLSTLEAVCHALMQLEGDAQRYQPLLAAFDGFIARQAAAQRAAVPHATNPDHQPAE
ncbi:MAG TPA: tRNA-uridine aminocarboxypropyltransferase [Noviherbaspirillum sp.]|jgi:DTW domain-containing protein YfiP|uniref:tRNA-uridine aminocarboxypropyltransferase n=1 Tax=Noviherbaspirillum sp. TaxID=1926288 RepID=UPI002DDCBAFC|nr:tRNA-uridine aminocarboxypropyltransferase [Noviherbaspirillum sp.]HEV2611906.1 tRNA-uridine aminocarboxypropyltransferase [Noviherbaspirillum sp.]